MSEVTMDLYLEDAGAGDPTVMLVHAGIADCRMWDREFAVIGTDRRVVRYDVRGFGRSPDPEGDYFDHVDLLGLMDQLGIATAVLVGASNGGRIVLDAAITAPGRVTGVVLAGSALPGIPMSESAEAIFRQEEHALRNGDYERAKQINLELWVDGVGRRPDQAPATVRDQIATWLDELLPRQGQQTRNARGEARLVEPPVRDRLGEVLAPALVMVGQHDQPHERAIAQHLAFHLPTAQLSVIDHAAHLVNLEQPDQFERLLLGFLTRLH